MLEVIKAEREHIKPISDKLRDADIKEVWASSRFYPFDAVNYSFNASEKAFTIIVDNEPIAMFGVVRLSLLSNIGVPWLLGTDGILKVKMTVVRKSRKYIKDMLQDYEILENYVHNENKVSKTWLRWCGFTIEKEQPRGPDRALFCRFFRRKEFQDV